MPTSVLDQAQNFSGGVVGAARQRDRWARREANATSEEEREQLREAIADLTARYPDLEDVPIGGAEAFARERGHGTGARSPVHEGRRRPAAGRAPRTAKKPAEPKPHMRASTGRKPVPGLDPTARRSKAQRRSAKGRRTPRVDRAIQQTGVPSATSSTGSFVMSVLGATIGMSLLYLLLSSAEKPGSGAAALPTVVESVTRGLGRFLGLEDVFPEGEAPEAKQLRPLAHENPKVGGGIPPWERRALRHSGLPHTRRTR